MWMINRSEVCANVATVVATMVHSEVVWISTFGGRSDCKDRQLQLQEPWSDAIGFDWKLSRAISTTIRLPALKIRPELVELMSVAGFPN